MDMSLTNSKALLQRAQKVIPGGVNSPVRAFKAVGGNPIFFKSGCGARIFDVDDNEYIDYVASWGPLILGHNHPSVIAAVQEAIASGLTFGAPTSVEVTLAETITKLMPSIEMVRMTSSGTEATMSALRLARGYTGRAKILKFDSCYHGHSDSLLVKAGSGLLTLGIANCAGVTNETAQDTLVVPYNDLPACQQMFEQYGNDIAAIIVEPIAANNNVILPVPGFLQGLRALCDQFKSVLIFDEVITGFRVALGGAQSLYDVPADITCLGKIIGGGMPVGAFGGRKEIFQQLAPLGPVYQAGTLSGNPVAMAAGYATLQALQKPGVYEQLATATETLLNSIKESAQQHHVKIDVRNVGSLFGLMFLDDPQQKLFNRFFHAMLDNGIYLAPSAFEAGFVSVAHDQTALDKSAAALHKSFASVAELPI
jgi:glutamate-1-semialdehyde 2,1-aminomutase